jgi:hypothetical protein
LFRIVPVTLIPDSAKLVTASVTRRAGVWPASTVRIAAAPASQIDEAAILPLFVRLTAEQSQMMTSKRWRQAANRSVIARLSEKRIRSRLDRPWGAGSSDSRIDGNSVMAANEDSASHCQAAFSTMPSRAASDGRNMLNSTSSVRSPAAAARRASA